MEAWKVILTYLPVKELLRSRAVCKTFRDFTSDNEFLLTHHSRQPSLPLVYFHGKPATDTNGGVAPVNAFLGTLDIRQTAGPPAVRLLLGFNDYVGGRRNHDFKILDSCDGLLLLTLSDGRLYICNPIRREWTALEKIRHRSFNFTALYRHGSEYHVLYGTKKGAEDIYIFTVGSAAAACFNPRQIGVSSERKRAVLEGLRLYKNGKAPAPVLVDGCLHWSAADHRSIVVFDPSEESFDLMDFHTQERVDYADLLEMGGRLGMCCIDNGYDMKVATVLCWDKENNSWSTKFRIEMPVDEMIHAVGQGLYLCGNVVSDNGDMLAAFSQKCCERPYLFHLDSKGNVLNKYGCGDTAPKTSPHRFKESLVKHSFLKKGLVKSSNGMNEPRFFRHNGLNKEGISLHKLASIDGQSKLPGGHMWTGVVDGAGTASALGGQQSLSNVRVLSPSKAHDENEDVKKRKQRPTEHDKEEDETPMVIKKKSIRGGAVDGADTTSALGAQSPSSERVPSPSASRSPTGAVHGSAQGNQNDPSTIPSEEDDIFMVLDDVPVETRISLDNNVGRDDLQRKVVRPPANLLVFEGDWPLIEVSELDSYLLATSSDANEYFEKRPFEFGEENHNVLGDLKDDNGSNTGINFDDDDTDMPNDIDVDTDVPTYPDETIAATPNGTQDDIDTHASLDDLCQSHLNASQKSKALINYLETIFESEEKDGNGIWRGDGHDHATILQRVSSSIDHESSEAHDENEDIKKRKQHPTEHDKEEDETPMVIKKKSIRGGAVDGADTTSALGAHSPSSERVPSPSASRSPTGAVHRADTASAFGAHSLSSERVPSPSAYRSPAPAPAASEAGGRPTKSPSGRGNSALGENLLEPRFGDDHSSRDPSAPFCYAQEIRGLKEQIALIWQEMQTLKEQKAQEIAALKEQIALIVQEMQTQKAQEIEAQKEHNAQEIRALNLKIQALEEQKARLLADQERVEADRRHCPKVQTRTAPNYLDGKPQQNDDAWANC